MTFTQARKDHGKNYADHNPQPELMEMDTIQTKQGLRVIERGNERQKSFIWR